MNRRNDRLLRTAGSVTDALGSFLKDIIEYKHGVMEDLFDRGTTHYLSKRFPNIRTVSWSVLELEEFLTGEGAVAEGPAEPTLTADTAGGVPVITASSIAELRLAPEKCAHVPDGFDIPERYRVRGADIVMARRGPASGACAIMPVFFQGGVLSGECIRLRPDPAKADPFFLGNVLHHYHRTGVLDTLMTGGGERELSVSLLRRLQVKLPPVEEQKMIASALLDFSGAVVAVEDMLKKISELQILLE